MDRNELEKDMPGKGPYVVLPDLRLGEWVKCCACHGFPTYGRHLTLLCVTTSVSLKRGMA